MALRKTLNLEGKVIVKTPIGEIDNGVQNLSVPAYIKVVAVSGDKLKLNAVVSFKGDTHSFNKNYELTASVADGSSNFIAQVYEHLKTLPEFAGATDC
jgi:hypothetical protein